MVGMPPQEKCALAVLSSSSSTSVASFPTTVSAPFSEQLLATISNMASSTSSAAPPLPVELTATTEAASSSSKNCDGNSLSMSGEHVIASSSSASACSSSSSSATSENCKLCVCDRCGTPIHDRFLYKVLDQNYHESCLRCADCQTVFTSTCFTRHNTIYCREHFLRRFGPKCSGCAELIGERSVVRKANAQHIYHVQCFQCLVCKRQFETGDQFYLIPVDGRLVCRDDFINFTNKESEMDCGNKRPRTTISAKSLETLKQAYQASSKPARHIREQLAMQTGLDMRVVQVWFQNRRAKEKRLKKDAGRRWNNNNNNAMINANGMFMNGGGNNDGTSMNGGGTVGGMNCDGSRGLDSDSSNDESLTGRSPLYGVGGYLDTSSDMDMHSELSYDPNYMPDSAAGCAMVLPPSNSMLAVAMHHSLLAGTSEPPVPPPPPLPLHRSAGVTDPSLNGQLYVDINAMSVAPTTSGTTTMCLGSGGGSGQLNNNANTMQPHHPSALTPNPQQQQQQQQLMNSGPATPLMHNSVPLHLNNNNGAGTPQQQSPLQHQPRQQQLAAAVAAATAAAAQQQQHEQQQQQMQQQFQQLQQQHQLMMQQHHQQQQQQHMMEQQPQQLHHFAHHDHHNPLLHSAASPFTESLMAYTLQ